MTFKQYIEVSEKFIRYAGKEVEYKSLNLHPTRDNQRKYIIKKAELVGVGVLGNSNHFILRNMGLMAIHYQNIRFPEV